MKLYRGIHQLQHAFPQGCALTIGNFDGVHLGHQSVIAHLKQEAQKRHLAAVVMLFEPQANEYFGGDNAPARLMRLRDKLHALKDANVDAVICIKFNHAFAKLSASDFIQQILLDKLHIKFLSVGDDFRFGANRQGDFHLLQNFAEKYHFTVEKNPTFAVNEERISSTAIRRIIAKSDFAQAEKLLDKPFIIRGRVIHGQQLGRTLNVPTANIRLHRQVCPVKGVFAVNVHLESGKTYQGVANLGSRPSVKGKDQLLEVHLFDFKGDLYGQRLEVTFCKKLRDEVKFPSLDALKNQIHTDITTAKAYFNTLK